MIEPGISELAVLIRQDRVREECMSFTMRMDRKHRSLYDLNPIASPFSLSSQANGRLSSPRRGLQRRRSASGLRRGSSQEEAALGPRQSFKGAMARRPSSALERKTSSAGVLNAHPRAAMLLRRSSTSFSSIVEEEGGGDSNKQAGARRRRSTTSIATSRKKQGSDKEVPVHSIQEMILQLKTTSWEPSVRRKVLRADLDTYLENLDDEQRQVFDDKVAEKVSDVAVEVREKYKKIQAKLNATPVFHPEVNAQRVHTMFLVELNRRLNPEAIENGVLEDMQASVAKDQEAKEARKLETLVEELFATSNAYARSKLQLPEGGGTSKANAIGTPTTNGNNNFADDLEANLSARSKGSGRGNVPLHQVEKTDDAVKRRPFTRDVLLRNKRGSFEKVGSLSRLKNQQGEISSSPTTKQKKTKEAAASSEVGEGMDSMSAITFDSSPTELAGATTTQPVQGQGSPFSTVGLDEANKKDVDGVTPLHEQQQSSTSSSEARFQKILDETIAGLIEQSQSQMAHLSQGTTDDKNNKATVSPVAPLETFASELIYSSAALGHPNFLQPTSIQGGSWNQQQQQNGEGHYLCTLSTPADADKQQKRKNRRQSYPPPGKEEGEGKQKQKQQRPLMKLAKKDGAFRDYLKARHPRPSGHGQNKDLLRRIRTRSNLSWMSNPRYENDIAGVYNALTDRQGRQAFSTAGADDGEEGKKEQRLIGGGLVDDLRNVRRHTKAMMEEIKASSTFANPFATLPSQPQQPQQQQQRREINDPAAFSVAAKAPEGSSPTLSTIMFKSVVMDTQQLPSNYCNEGQGQQPPHHSSPPTATARGLSRTTTQQQGRYLPKNTWLMNNTSGGLSTAHQDLAKDLQERVEKVMKKLKMPISQRLTFLQKYCDRYEAGSLPDALVAWEKATEIVLLREVILEMKEDESQLRKRREGGSIGSSKRLLVPQDSRLHDSDDEEEKKEPAAPAIDRSHPSLRRSSSATSSSVESLISVSDMVNALLAPTKEEKLRPILYWIDPITFWEAFEKNPAMCEKPASKKGGLTESAAAAPEKKKKLNDELLAGRKRSAIVSEEGTTASATVTGSTAADTITAGTSAAEGGENSGMELKRRCVRAWLDHLLRECNKDLTQALIHLDVEFKEEVTYKGGSLMKALGIKKTR